MISLIWLLLKDIVNYFWLGSGACGGGGVVVVVDIASSVQK
jgi:hypothetical protein